MDFYFQCHLVKFDYYFITEQSKIFDQNLFPDKIKEKLTIIHQMDPINIDDFIPLLAIETDELQNYKCMFHKSIGRDHPIYYFSEKLNVCFLFLGFIWNFILIFHSMGVNFNFMLVNFRYQRV